MAFTKTIVFALVAIIAIESVASLTCHHCSSRTGLNLPCENNPTEVSTCSAGDVCVKHIIAKPASEVITRSCAGPNICESLNAQYANNPAVTVKHCSTCNSNNCN